jgi:hypothetical protein
VPELCKSIFNISQNEFLKLKLRSKSKKHSSNNYLNWLLKGPHSRNHPKIVLNVADVSALRNTGGSINVGLGILVHDAGKLVRLTCPCPFSTAQWQGTEQ